ncbi:restriction endonuclease subunit S [Eubacterium ruminantium]|uniref:restriction endonuclease subunit S n=1 Tax=Eubacterium ruminantium TaxID=42322 RepID=UPI00247A702B|nr:restriction endonuclease subunit S [Eubacterium ruminantium]
MEYKALKEIAKITMGQSPDSSSYNEDGDGMPFFQGNADFGEIYPNERIWCNDPKKTAEPGDILISVRAPIGALNYAKDRCCIGRGLAAITIDDEAERNYVFHLLKAKNSDLNNQGTGSTFKAIGKAVLEDVQVPQISREEQQKCMDMMDLLESIIRERRAQLSSLDELIKARFVEMFENDSDENTYRLEEIADIVSGITKGRKTKETEFREVPYMAVSNVKDGYIDWTTVKTILATEDEIRQYKLMSNDVLMTEGGDPDKLGRGAIISNPPEDCIHQNHIFRVRLDEKRVLPRYFSAYL